MRALSARALAAAATFAVAVACGSAASRYQGDAPAGGADAGDSRPKLPTDDVGARDYPCDGCAPFPGFGAPECPFDVLGKAAIAYPTDGLLLPPNMNVLEVQFTPPAGATLFEVDLYNGVTKVKVKTRCVPVPDVRGGPSRGCGVTLPLAAWRDVADANRGGGGVGVTVRATRDGSCVSLSNTPVQLLFAEEDLAGGIYYWQSATFGGVGGTTGGIYLHDFGTFDPSPTPFYTSGTTGTCVGCHVLSRDGARMALATDDPDGDDELSDVFMHTMDVATRTVVGGAAVRPGFQTFTHDHAKMIASTWLPPGKSGPAPGNAGLDVWDGDGRTLLATMPFPSGLEATQPDLSRDDRTLLFVVPKEGTISTTGDHHFEGGAIWAATFDAAANVMAAPTAVLSDPSRSFYYPSLSPDGSFVVFDDAPQPGNTATTNDDAFYNRGARVKILRWPPRAPATPIDLPLLNLAGNLTNSWPRWSPFVQTYKGKKLLWVTFSSNRGYGLRLVNAGFDSCYPPESPDEDQPQPLSRKNVTYAGCAQPQIWMAGVLVDDDAALDAPGKDRSFPAFWLPFQDVNSHNHGAQWVEAVQGAPPSDVAGEGGTCAAVGDACANAECCSDAVCCNGVCSVTCVR